jgi:5-methylcytosine-specific restriction endonuclease McrA
VPWGRIDDRLAMSVKIRGLADAGAQGDRALAQRCEALGAWTQILSWVSGERSDGFFTEDIARLFARREALDRLLRGQYGRAPLVHRRQDAEACECFEGRQWPPGWDYLVHDYLDRNPSRQENDVHRAKSRELKDSALKTRIARRDLDRCRYCGRQCKPSDRRSDDGRTFDHVDPLVADGEANLVTACRGCNRRKGRRTPEAAGMVLLPIGGTEADAAAALVPAPAPALQGPPGDVEMSESSVHGSGSGSAPDLNPDLSPDLNPTQIRHRSGSRSDDPPEPEHPRSGPSQATEDQVSDLDPTTDPTQIVGSPGTGRDGTGTGPDPGRLGPPPPRAPTRALSPYARPGPRNPDHHAGVPADPSPIPGDP